MNSSEAAYFFTRRTISRDLTLSLALMTALVVSVFGATYQIYTTRLEAQNLERAASAIADEFTEVLARPLWNLDIDTVNQIARAYLSSDFLTGVRISTDLETFFDNVTDHPPVSQRLSFTREIVNEGEIIGSADLFFSKKRIDIVRTRSLVLTLVTIALVTFVIGLGTHQLMKRLVVKPLDRLIDGVRTIAAGDYQRALPHEKRADINTLVSEINIMAREIDHRESDLKKLREMLKSIVDSMPSVLVGVDPEGRVTQWNREAWKQTGIEASEAIGRRVETVFPSLSEVMQKVGQAMQDKHACKEGKVARHVDGELRYADITVYPLMTGSTGGAVIRVDDITERVRIEEMMVQSEKMLSVGGLAAGMAHEINNPLAGIMQNVQVMQNRLYGDLSKNHEVAEQSGTSMAAIQTYMQGRHIPDMLAMIMESGQRAAQIVENMLSFSRKSGAAATLNDLGQLLDDTLALARNDYDLKKRYDFRQIEIVRKYDSTVPLVACEASQIQQVFLNILKNGAQAMAQNADTPSPRFVLRVRADGTFVRVEIEDNGPGMPPEVCKRIFEPFYTTKSVGVGTGLGLSVSYFIITENHGGRLTVISAPGAGSRFIVLLPVGRVASRRSP